MEIIMEPTTKFDFTNHYKIYSLFSTIYIAEKIDSNWVKIETLTDTIIKWIESQPTPLWKSTLGDSYANTYLISDKLFLMLVLKYPTK